MKKLLITTLCILVVCLSVAFLNNSNINNKRLNFQIQNVLSIQNKAGKKSFALNTIKKGKKIFAYSDSEQQLKVLFNNKTFLLNLKDYEIYSPVHTTKLTENKYARNQSLENKLIEIEKLTNLGLSLKQSFNLVCPKIENDINNILKSANYNAMDAKIKLNTKTNKFEFTPEKYGYSLKEDDCYKLIFDAFKNNQSKLLLNATKVSPTYFLSDLKQCTNLRGAFSTNYALSTPERKNNIKLALSKFNGITLMPNQTLSFNKTTGERTEKKGYKQAKIILNGSYVDGTGGGVCQASTTFYNACLLSDIDVVSSCPHTLPASYVDAGFDAMVSFGSSDLIIKNTTNGPITFATSFTDTNCTVKVYGLSLNNIKIELISEVIKELDEKPNSTISALDKNVKPNTIVRPAFKGFEIQTHAIYKKDDVIFKTKKIRKSVYKSQGEIIAI